VTEYIRELKAVVVRARIRLLAIGCTLLLATIFMLAAGCGGGPLGLTGGSIPIGTAALRGVVVRADNITQPLEGAVVTLHTGSLHNDATSDSNGRFDVGQFAGGAFTCTVQPPENSDLSKEWSWDFSLSNGVPGQIVISLWPARFDPDSVGNVTMSPAQYTLHVGDSVRLVANAYDKNGAILLVKPSFLLAGTGATIQPDGTVNATALGSITIYAWMAGKMATTNIAVIP